MAAIAVIPASLLGITVAQHIFLKISREALMRAVALLMLSGACLIYRAFWRVALSQR